MDRKTLIKCLEDHDIEVADPETGQLCLRLSVEKAEEIVTILMATEEREEALHGH